MQCPLVGDPNPSRSLAGSQIGERIATARQRECLAACDRARDRARTLAELVILEYPDRPVPDDGPRTFEELGEALD